MLAPEDLFLCSIILSMLPFHTSVPCLLHYLVANTALAFSFLVRVRIRMPADNLKARSLSNCSVMTSVHVGMVWCLSIGPIC
jgi:hypothetical protein